MGIVHIDPTVLEYPVLQEGIYGPGLDNEADVELSGFECPAEEKMPAYDPEGERGPYAFFGFKVKTAEGKLFFVDHWTKIGTGSGPEVSNFLECAKVDKAEDGQGGFDFDTSDVAPRKVNGVQMAAPTTSKNTGAKYNGRVKAIIG